MSLEILVVIYSNCDLFLLWPLLISKSANGLTLSKTLVGERSVSIMAWHNLSPREIPNIQGLSTATRITESIALSRINMMSH